jgi:hypothetical protein
VSSRATIALIVFAVFAASTAGQVILEFIPERVAIPAGAGALIAGMGFLALGLAPSSATLLVLGGLGLRAAGLTFAALVAGLSAVVLIPLAQAHSAGAGARGQSVAHAGSTS